MTDKASTKIFTNEYSKKFKSKIPELTVSDDIGKDLDKLLDNEKRNTIVRIWSELFDSNKMSNTSIQFYLNELFRYEPSVRIFFGYNEDSDLDDVERKNYDFVAFTASVMSFTTTLITSLDDNDVVGVLVQKLADIHKNIPGFSMEWMYYWGE